MIGLYSGNIPRHKKFGMLSGNDWVILLEEGFISGLYSDDKLIINPGWFGYIDIHMLPKRTH